VCSCPPIGFPTHCHPYTRGIEKPWVPASENFTIAVTYKDYNHHYNLSVGRIQEEDDCHTFHFRVREDIFLPKESGGSGV
jgi:hypothetical protein